MSGLISMPRKHTLQYNRRIAAYRENWRFRHGQPWTAQTNTHLLKSCLVLRRQRLAFKEEVSSMIRKKLTAYGTFRGHEIAQVSYHPSQ